MRKYLLFIILICGCSTAPVVNSVVDINTTSLENDNLPDFSKTNLFYFHPEKWRSIDDCHRSEKIMNDVIRHLNKNYRGKKVVLHRVIVPGNGRLTEDDKTRIRTHFKILNIHEIYPLFIVSYRAPYGDYYRTHVIGGFHPDDKKNWSLSYVARIVNIWACYSEIFAHTNIWGTTVGSRFGSKKIEDFKRFDHVLDMESIYFKKSKIVGRNIKTKRIVDVDFTKPYFLREQVGILFGKLPKKTPAKE